MRRALTPHRILLFMASTAGLLCTPLPGVAGPSALQMATGLSAPAAAYQLPDPEQNARLQQILSILGTRPESTEALAQLDALLEEVIGQAGLLGDQGRLAEMDQLLGVVQAVNPTKAGLEQARQQLEVLRQVEGWLARARKALGSDRLIEPPEQNAAYYFQRVRAAMPDHPEALAGLHAVQQRLIVRALATAGEGDFELAAAWLDEAALLPGDAAAVDRARAEIEDVRFIQARRIEQEVLGLIEDGAFNQAERTLIDLIALGGNESLVGELRRRIEATRRYGAVQPGEIFRDAMAASEAEAPILVVVAAGSFLMGSPRDEEGHTENEAPQHRVTIQRGFALGLHEVTVGQFRHFVKSSRYRTRAEREGYSSLYDESTGRLTDREGVDWRHDYRGRKASDDLPVLHVSWEDAMAYAGWLSEQTGKPYRLPSEAEFEYALRAGSTTAYWWGQGAPSRVIENLTGDGDQSAGGRGWSLAFESYEDGHWGPAPAAAFEPNPFGLYDMAGNVSEWVMDCWHANYLRAPVDGGTWSNPGCKRHVVRGGYWAGSPSQARSASRLYAATGLRGSRVGFRVARDL